MNSKRLNNWTKGCLNKKVYRTEEFANKQAELYSEKYDKQQYVYFCMFCNGYHLTSKKHDKPFVLRDGK